MDVRTQELESCRRDIRRVRTELSTAKNELREKRQFITDLQSQLTAKERVVKAVLDEAKEGGKIIQPSQIWALDDDPQRQIERLKATVASQATLISMTTVQLKDAREGEEKQKKTLRVLTANLQDNMGRTITKGVEEALRGLCLDSGVNVQDIFGSRHPSPQLSVSDSRSLSDDSGDKHKATAPPPLRN